MSRFEEVVGEVIDEVVLGEAFKAEVLAAHIAERVRERQEGLRAEVTIAARYPETVRTPVSGLETQEIYTLFGTAVASQRGTRTLTGVQAQGMTACPCAQGLVEDRSRERLAEPGLRRRGDRARARGDSRRDPQPARHRDALRRLPRGLRASPIDARDLLHIVEQSMSSEIYGLMKRSDEVEVVEKAHRRPRFVEDCVREMIRSVIETYPELGDDGASSAPARRTSRRSTATTSSRSAPACCPRSAPRSRAASTRRHHLTMREWLEAPRA